MLHINIKVDSRVLLSIEWPSCFYISLLVSLHLPFTIVSINSSISQGISFLLSHMLPIIDFLPLLYKTVLLRSKHDGNNDVV